MMTDPFSLSTTTTTTTQSAQSTAPRQQPRQQQSPRQQHHRSNKHRRSLSSDDNQGNSRFLAALRGNSNSNGHSHREHENDKDDDDDDDDEQDGAYCNTSILDESTGSSSVDHGTTISQAETELHDNRDPSRPLANLRFLTTAAAKVGTTTNSTSPYNKTPPSAASPMIRSLSTPTTTNSSSPRAFVPGGAFFTRTPIAHRSGYSSNNNSRHSGAAMAPAPPSAPPPIMPLHHNRVRAHSSDNNNKVTGSVQQPQQQQQQQQHDNPHSAASSPPTTQQQQESPSEPRPSMGSNTISTVNDIVQSPPLLARRPVAIQQGSRNLSTEAFANNSPNKKHEPQQQQKSEDAPPGDLGAEDTNAKSAEPTPVWEEEATPEQTAFGKQLLFARPQPAPADATSDSGALSTASEMGTVINIGGRLADLDSYEEEEAAAATPAEHEIPNQHDYYHHDALDDSLRPQVGEDDNEPERDQPALVQQHTGGLRQEDLAAAAARRRQNDTNEMLTRWRMPLEHSNNNHHRRRHYDDNNDECDDDDDDDDIDDDEEDDLFLRPKPSPSFQRETDAMSESILSSEGVLSTASEMGTVINVGRLAELDEDNEFHQQQQQQQNQQTESSPASLSLPQVASTGNKEGADQSKDHDDNEENVTQLKPRPFLHSSNSDPKLRSGGGGSNNETTTTSSSSRHRMPDANHMSMAIRKAMAAKQQQPRRRTTSLQSTNEEDEEEANEEEENKQKTGNTAEEEEDELVDLVSVASRSFPKAAAAATTVTRAIPHSFSWSEGEGIEVTLSPTAYSASAAQTVEIPASPSTVMPPNNNDGRHPQRSMTPASFLLRSPGSSAFLAASSQKKKKRSKKKSESLWRSRRQHQHQQRRGGDGESNTSAGAGDDIMTPDLFSSSNNTVSSSTSSMSLSSKAMATASDAAPPPPSTVTSPQYQSLQQRAWMAAAGELFVPPVVNEDEVLKVQDPDEDDDGDEIGVLAARNDDDDGLISPMRIERACFSFDQYDSVLNKQQYQLQQQQQQEPPSFLQRPLSSAGNLLKSKAAPSQAGSTHVLLGGAVSLSWDVSGASSTAGAVSGGPYKSPMKPSRRQQQQQHHRGRGPRAKDGGNNDNYRTIFTAAPRPQSFVRGGASASLTTSSLSSTAPQQSTTNNPGTTTTITTATTAVDRLPPHPPPPTDFSPLLTNPNDNIMSRAEELKTPQRIEIEREDAIDILACLVERGVSLHSGGAGSANETTTDQSPPSSAAPLATDGSSRRLPRLPVVGDGNDNEPDDDDDDNSLSGLLDPYSSGIVQHLRDLAEMEANEEKRLANLKMIDELVKSHVYALEMSRAAKSACSWLKSIGRQAEDGDDGENDGDDDAMVEKKEDDTAMKRRPQQQTTRRRSSGANTTTNIDLLTTKARLHVAQEDLATKSAELHRLNQELATCRAEIGRLTAAQQSAAATMALAAASSAAATTPGRSILDEEDYEDDTGDEDTNPNNTSNNDKSLLDEDDGDKTLLIYKSALNEANSRIGQLHSTLLKETQMASPDNNTADQDGGENDSGRVPRSPPYVVIEDHEEEAFNDQPQADLQQQQHRRLSPGNKDSDMIHVHMLDGENFITDWDDLSPLPPPPDHTLRSPMVTSVLESWTQDQGLHESMLSWMESILTGSDPESVPPLTISSLDHQVKDGFTLHVLPLLLRRKDLHVNVKTRAHRRTTYDIAVTVDRPSLTGLDMRRHLETIAARSDVGGGAVGGGASVTHSMSTTLMGNTTGAALMGAAGQTLMMQDDPIMGASATTTNNNNVTPPNQQGLMYDEMAEDMDADVSSTNTPGLMSALGGALGGFLNRNRGKQLSTAMVEQQPHNETPQVLDATSSSSPTLHHTNMNSNNMPPPPPPPAELDDEQPYHRVVSAPPGRIGVTFVEFRGHAMVSDVAPDSPLQGWIFPSDILIAIDELPVSGMRVRDIIAVLKERTDRQRALRIISCHAMNEITELHHTGSSSSSIGASSTVVGPTSVGGGGGLFGAGES